MIVIFSCSHPNGYRRQPGTLAHSVRGSLYLGIQKQAGMTRSNRTSRSIAKLLPLILGCVSKVSSAE